MNSTSSDDAVIPAGTGGPPEPKLTTMPLERLSCCVFGMPEGPSPLTVG